MLLRLDTEQQLFRFPQVRALISPILSAEKEGLLVPLAAVVVVAVLGRQDPLETTVPMVRMVPMAALDRQDPEGAMAALDRQDPEGAMAALGRQDPLAVVVVAALGRQDPLV
jgi:hypothetical protein